jgi:superfamily II DNA/RNA helicase
MGKTVATLTTLEDLFMAGAETQPALVLAPLRVAASTWPDEAVKWGHLRNIEVQPIVGNAKARAAALANSNASVFTINYDNLVWLVEELAAAGRSVPSSRRKHPAEILPAARWR